MSALGEVADVAKHVATIAADVSEYAGPEGKAVGAALVGSAALVAGILKAIDDGIPQDTVIAAVAAIADTAMRGELGP